MRVRLIFRSSSIKTHFESCMPCECAPRQETVMAVERRVPCTTIGDHTHTFVPFSGFSWQVYSLITELVLQ